MHTRVDYSSITTCPILCGRTASYISNVYYCKTPHATNLSNRRTARRKQRKNKINSGRDNASVSSCKNNECDFLNVITLVSGNSPTFRKNLQPQSAIHKKLLIPEDFVAFTAVRTPTSNYKFRRRTALLRCHSFPQKH